MNKFLNVEQLGLLAYEEAVHLQHQRVAQRKASEIPDTLLLLEHPHVYTLGRNTRREHLLVSPEHLRKLGAEVYETDRGGDITYHGPGQLVGYPILDLAQHRRDISWYMRSLEEVFIGVATDFGAHAGRLPGAAGVWVGDNKLVAMGVHVSRWVTSHGFAFNVSTDLSYFAHIVPCGLHGKGVTSLQHLAGKSVEMETVIEKVLLHFGDVFGFQMQQDREYASSSRR
ncbi:MAG TPA: lipoyl(octanoyl) transferase LipB [Terriglobia bacterium]|nr:lipoyl(octanoyl) transferase LipB [Terriglobia bacterium]